MNIVSRGEFTEYFESIMPGVSEPPYSVLWYPEDQDENKCNWFICLDRSLGHPRLEYHRWCRKNLRFAPRCFSSSPEEEWWGFVEYDDIFLWLLRWR
jgi:hypothetical protein